VVADDIGLSVHRRPIKNSEELNSNTYKYLIVQFEGDGYF